MADTLRNALMLAEEALETTDRACGDPPPRGRCSECLGCLRRAALTAVRRELALPEEAPA